MASRQTPPAKPTTTARTTTSSAARTTTTTTSSAARTSTTPTKPTTTSARTTPSSSSSASSSSRPSAVSPSRATTTATTSAARSTVKAPSTATSPAKPGTRTTTTASSSPAKPAEKPATKPVAHAEPEKAEKKSVEHQEVKEKHVDPPAHHEEEQHQEPKVEKVKILDQPPVVHTKAEEHHESNGSTHEVVPVVEEPAAHEEPPKVEKKEEDKKEDEDVPPVKAKSKVYTEDVVIEDDEPPPGYVPQSFDPKPAPVVEPVAEPVIEPVIAKVEEPKPVVESVIAKVEEPKPVEPKEVPVPEPVHVEKEQEPHQPEPVAVPQAAEVPVEVPKEPHSEKEPEKESKAPSPSIEAKEPEKPIISPSSSSSSSSSASKPVEEPRSPAPKAAPSVGSPYGVSSPSKNVLTYKAATDDLVEGIIALSPSSAEGDEVDIIEKLFNLENMLREFQRETKQKQVLQYNKKADLDWHLKWLGNDKSIDKLRHQLVLILNFQTNLDVKRLVFVVLSRMGEIDKQQWRKLSNDSAVNQILLDICVQSITQVLDPKIRKHGLKLLHALFSGNQNLQKILQTKHSLLAEVVSLVTGGNSESRSLDLKLRIHATKILELVASKFKQLCHDCNATRALILALQETPEENPETVHGELLMQIAASALRDLILNKKGEIDENLDWNTMREISKGKGSAARPFVQALEARVGADVMAFYEHLNFKREVSSDDEVAHSSSSAISSTVPKVPKPLKEVVEFPPFWRKFSTPYVEFDLSPSSEEFRLIQSLVKRTNLQFSTPSSALSIFRSGPKVQFYGDLQIERIIRLQNYYQWRRFFFQRDQIDHEIRLHHPYSTSSTSSSATQVLASSPFSHKAATIPTVASGKTMEHEVRLTEQELLDKKTNECYLFHAATWTQIQHLKVYGFSEFYAAQNPKHAIYFTDNSCKVLNSIPCPSCHKVDCLGCANSLNNFGLLVSRVCLGFPLELQNSVRDYESVPDPTYHSLLSYSRSLDPSSSVDYSEFAVFNPAQIYPEYVVQFRKRT